MTSEAPIPPGVTGVQLRLSCNNWGGVNTPAKRQHLTSTSVGSSFAFDDVCPGEYTIEVSLVYDIPGGSRSQGFPSRLDPRGSFEVQAGRVTEVDVILFQ